MELLEEPGFPGTEAPPSSPGLSRLATSAPTVIAAAPAGNTAASAAWIPQS